MLKFGVTHFEGQLKQFIYFLPLVNKYYNKSREGHLPALKQFVHISSHNYYALMTRISFNSFSFLNFG